MLNNSMKCEYQTSFIVVRSQSNYRNGNFLKIWINQCKLLKIGIYFVLVFGMHKFFQRHCVITFI